MNFASTSKFAIAASPSASSGYTGCTVPADNHSVRYKRRGFTSGIYRIDIPNHDDECTLLVNGVQVFTHNGWGDAHNGVWTGNLDATSTVEFRWREFAGNSIGALNFTTVSAPALIAGSASANQTVCSGDDPIGLSSVSPYSGGCYFMGYQWQSSTNNTTYTDISGATSATYDPPAGITQTTYYRRKATDACNQVQYTTPIVVTVNTVVPGDPAVFGNSMWNAYVYKDDNFTTYGGYYTESTLDFDSRTLWNNTFSPSTPTNLTTGYQGCQIPVNNHSVSYKRRGFPTGTYQLNIPAHDDYVALIINGVTVFNHDGCCDSHTNVWTGNLNASSTIELRWREFGGESFGNLTFTTTTPATSVSPGAIASSQSICYSGDPAAFTSTQPASSTCYVYYQWQASTDNTNWFNITNATSLTYDAPSGLLQTTYYRRLATDACTNSASATATVTVYGSLSAGTINSAQIICYNTAPLQLTTDINPSGGIGTYTYAWQSSTNGTTWTTIGSTNSTSYTPGALTTSTYFRKNVTSGTCGTVSTPSILITVNPNLTAGSIGTAHTRCENVAAAQLTSTGNPTGGNGAFSYQWQSSNDNTTWSDISGANLNQYSPGVLPASTYFRRRVTSGTSCPAYTSSVLVTITPRVTVSVSINTATDEICAGTSVTFNASTTTGGLNPGYQWKVNNGNVGTGASFTSSTLQNNDVVTCVLTSNHTCINGSNSATSNAITMTVYSTGNWIGGSDGSWINPSNWCGSIPSATTDVTIRADAPNMPVINGAGVCRNLTVEAGATLTISNGFSLNIHGNWVNNGTFIPNQGTIRYAGAGAQTILALNYYNLESLGSANRSLSTAGTIGIAGTFNPATSNFLYTGSNINFNGTTDQEIPALTYNNLTVSGSGNKTLSGNVIVNGTFDAPLIDLANRSLTLNGNLTSNTIFKGTEHSDLILGNTSSITGSLKFQSGFEDLRNLLIQKDMILTLGTPITVHGILQFPTSGKIHTDATNLLTLGVSATHIGSSSTSFVDGPMAKVLDDIGEFTFPIGKGSLFRQAAVITESKLETTFTAEFLNSDPSVVGATIEKPALHHISSVEYWNIHKDGLSRAKVKLYWGLGSYVSLNEIDHLSLRVAHFNSTSNIWENKGAVLDISSDYTAGNLTTEDFLSDFSPFTFSSTNPKNSLPVVYKYFEVQKDENTAILEWETKTEVNNHSFEIEKSVDDLGSFSSIGYLNSTRVKSAGSVYTFKDYEFNNKTSYYRLKQIDNNGNYAYSEVKVLKADKIFGGIKIVPNPTAGEVEIRWEGSNPNGKVSYNISSITGTEISNKVVTVEEISKSISNDLKLLPSGVYVINVMSENGFYTEKVIKL